jgi:hypothetical protein
VKQYSVSFRAEEPYGDSIITEIRDVLEAENKWREIFDVVVHENDEEATMGVPPDGETPADAFLEKMHNRLENESWTADRDDDPMAISDNNSDAGDVPPSYTFTMSGYGNTEPPPAYSREITNYQQSIQPLFAASELLAKHSDQMREQNERIIQLLENIADELIILVDTFVEEDNG